MANIEITSKVASPVKLVFLKHLLSAIVTGSVSSLNTELLDVELRWPDLRVQAVSAWALYTYVAFVFLLTINLLLYNTLISNQAVMLVLLLISINYIAAPALVLHLIAFHRVNINIPIQVVLSALTLNLSFWAEFLVLNSFVVSEDLITSVMVTLKLDLL